MITDRQTDRQAETEACMPESGETQKKEEKKKKKKKKKRKEKKTVAQ